jgi:hypothetical protein
MAHKWLTSLTGRAALLVALAGAVIGSAWYVSTLGGAEPALGPPERPSPLAATPGKKPPPRGEEAARPGKGKGGPREGKGEKDDRARREEERERHLLRAEEELLRHLDHWIRAEMDRERKKTKK